MTLNRWMVWLPSRPLGEDVLHDRQGRNSAGAATLTATGGDMGLTPARVLARVPWAGAAVAAAMAISIAVTSLIPILLAAMALGAYRFTRLW